MMSWRIDEMGLCNRRSNLLQSLFQPPPCHTAQRLDLDVCLSKTLLAPEEPDRQYMVSPKVRLTCLDTQQLPSLVRPRPTSYLISPSFPPSFPPSLPPFPPSLSPSLSPCLPPSLPVSLPVSLPLSLSPSPDNVGFLHWSLWKSEILFSPARIGVGNSPVASPGQQSRVIAIKVRSRVKIVWTS